MNLQDLTTEDWEELGSFMGQTSPKWDVENFNVFKYHYMSKSTVVPILYDYVMMHRILKKVFQQPFDKVPLLVNNKTGLFGMPFAQLILKFRLVRGL